MKRIALLIIFVSFIIFGCRKGEDDPFFSLRSRTNRLCGTWRVIEFEKTILEGTSPWDYDQYDLILASGQAKVIYHGVEYDKYSHIENWTFDKKGNYIIDYSIKNIPAIESGTWSWNGKDKNSDYKKKQCIYLKMTNWERNYGEELEEHSGSALSRGVVVINKLSDKEMTCNIEASHYYANDNYYYKIISKIILEKQEE